MSRVMQWWWTYGFTCITLLVFYLCLIESTNKEPKHAFTAFAVASSRKLRYIQTRALPWFGHWGWFRWQVWFIYHVNLCVVLCGPIHCCVSITLLLKEHGPYSSEDIFFDVGDYKSNEQEHHRAWESARIQCCNPGVEELEEWFKNLQQSRKRYPHCPRNMNGRTTGRKPNSYHPLPIVWNDFSRLFVHRSTEGILTTQ
jgi:hypothetical protein